MAISEPRDGPDLAPVLVQLHQISPCFVLLPLPEDFASYYFARRRFNSQDRLRRDALAATALSHNAQSLPGGKVNTDTVNRPDDTLVGEEIGLKVSNLKQ